MPFYFIKHHESITCLHSFRRDEEDLIEVSAGKIVAMVDRFLAAVAMNGKINTLTLMGPCTAHSLANCLTSLGASLHTLVVSVYGISFPEATAEDDAEMLVSVIRSLSHLEVLDLQCDKMHFVMPFLNQLGGGDGPPLKLKRLDLDTTDTDTYMPEPLAQAIHQTLVSARLLETFEFCHELNENHPNEENLDIVLSSIQQHPSISDVHLSGIPFALSVQLLLPNRNIQSLDINCNTLMGVCTIMEAIAAARHPLRLLKVRGNDFAGEGYAEGLQQIGELLPQLKGLKELNLAHEPEDLEVLDRPPAPVPHQLLRGFKLNTSLHRVEMNWPLSEDNHVERAIDFYTARNKFSQPLADATTAKMLTIFREDVLGSQSYYESELSVIFETLRVRDDWFDKIDGPPRRKRRRKEV